MNDKKLKKISTYSLELLNKNHLIEYKQYTENLQI